VFCRKVSRVCVPCPSSRPRFIARGWGKIWSTAPGSPASPVLACWGGGALGCVWWKPRALALVCDRRGLHQMWNCSRVNILKATIGPASSKPSAGAGAPGKPGFGLLGWGGASRW